MTPSSACLNCKTPFAQPDGRPPRFCPECGQETNVRPPTLTEFAQQFGGAYFATEGALWRSLRLLVLKPGALTTEYLAGRRKRYVLPLRLYLTISLLALLLMRLAGGGPVTLQAGTPEQVAKANLNFQIHLGTGESGLRNGTFYCENLPAWLCHRIQRRIDIDPKAMLGEYEALKDRFLANLGSAMFVLLPAFALWLKLALLNRGLRYTEHLVFALHVHAFWFLALLLTLPGWEPVKVLAALVVPVYTLLAMRRVYGGRWWPRLLRSALITVLYLTTMVLALTMVGLMTLLS